MFNYNAHSMGNAKGSNLQLTSIFGAELKKCKGLCVNYLNRKDLYEKRLFFTLLKSQTSI